MDPIRTLHGPLTDTRPPGHTQAQAREYLYFKVFGKQLLTPIAIMTSAAKGNHRRVTELCAREGWFGRGKGAFRLFQQALVPVVCAERGQWAMDGPGAPMLKPGGHGVMWKLAQARGRGRLRLLTRKHMLVCQTGAQIR